MEYRGANYRSVQLLNREQLKQLGRDGAITCDFAENVLFKDKDEIPEDVTSKVDSDEKKSENEV